MPPSPRTPLGRLHASVVAAHRAAASRDERAQLAAYTQLLESLDAHLKAVTLERDRALRAVLRRRGTLSLTELAEDLRVSRQRVDQLVRAATSRRRRRSNLLTR